jgi:uncharacterized protein involved in outer membrane biogenesis
MKKWLYILVAVLVIALGLGMAKDLIIKSSVEKGVEMVTGLRLKMAFFHAGILNHTVHIKGLELLNPTNFKDRTMLKIPEIYADYDLGAVFSGKMHLKVLRIDIAELYVIRNPEGFLNLDYLNTVKSAKSGGSIQGSMDKLPPFMIDNLNLKVGKVAYKDYVSGMSTGFDIGLDESFQNVDSVEKLVNIIVVRALMNTSIASLAHFDLGVLQNFITGSAVNSTTSLVGRVTGSAAQQAADTVENAASSLLGAFGGKKQ